MIKHSLFKRQRHKMVKHIQTIHRLLPTNCWSVFDHFVELMRKGLKSGPKRVSDLRSETKGSRFEFGCYLCVEVSSLQ